MKAIQVRYLSATHFKGGRIKAFAEGGNEIVMPFPYELSSDELRVDYAARELIHKLSWKVEISGIGQLPCGDWAVTLS